MSVRYILNQAHDFNDWITPVLSRHRDWWSQQVIASQDHDGEIVLTGRVGSYYHKQLAQEAFRQLPQAQRVRNEIQVVR